MCQTSTTLDYMQNWHKKGSWYDNQSYIQYKKDMCCPTNCGLVLKFIFLEQLNKASGIYCDLCYKSLLEYQFDAIVSEINDLFVCICVCP